MACPAVQSGQNFLGMLLYSVDCQAQAIGAYGFGALANPGSTTSIALTGLLTLFIAIFGVRMLLGYPLAGKDVVSDIARVGIVLTLATSWPAWRVVGYDLIIHGPEQVARAIGIAAQLPGTGGNMLEHLQRVDEGFAAFNTYGSGRLGVAQGDWFQLGFARSAYLLGTLVPLALVKLTTGILLAIAPLMAGLLLFGVSRPLFEGWVRGLALVFLASIALTLIIGTELALIEPWLKDALEQRAANTQVLDAPTEALVLTLGFGLVSLGVIWVMGRVAFQSVSVTSIWTTLQSAVHRNSSNSRESQQSLTQIGGDSSYRAQTVAMAVATSVQREDRLRQTMRSGDMGQAGGQGTNPGAVAGRTASLAASEALGSSYRRGSRRVSQTGAQRDQRR
jgi:type IV secretion system protein VirB6